MLLMYGKKSDAVCRFLAYFCAVLRFSDPPLRPPPPVSVKGRFKWKYVLSVEAPKEKMIDFTTSLELKKEMGGRNIKGCPLRIWIKRKQ